MIGGFVLPDRVAIGASDGELTMRLTGNMGAHRVLGHDSGRARPNRAIVPARRLDTWVEALGFGSERRFTDILVYNTESNPSQRNAAG